MNEKLADIILHQDTTGFTLSLWFDEEFMPKVNLSEILGVNMPFEQRHADFIQELIRRNMFAYVNGNTPVAMDIKYVNCQRGFTVNIDGNKAGGYVLN